MKKTISVIFVIFAIAFTGTHTTHAKSTGVLFVKQVSKRCKHLGSVSHTFESDALYKAREGFRVVPAGPVFATAMKAKARKMGANRLVLIEVFNDKTIQSGMGYHEWINRSELRARAFRCQG